MSEGARLTKSGASEIEVRADEVRLGDYLLGLGRVQAITRYHRVLLHSEGNDWKVNVDRRHRVVVLRTQQREPPLSPQRGQSNLPITPRSTSGQVRP